MNGYFVNSDGRQIVVELRPVGAAIKRCPQAELGAAEQQVLVLNVLAQAARRAPRQIRAERAERLAKILADKNVGLVVVRAVSVESHINAAVIEPRGFNRRNPAWS